MGLQPEQIDKMAKVGTDILFIMPDGELRPGKIVHRWPDTNPEMAGYCNAVVFLDGTNDAPADASPEDRAKYGNCIMWATSIYHSQPYPGQRRPGGYIFPQEA